MIVITLITVGRATGNRPASPRNHPFFPLLTKLTGLSRIVPMLMNCGRYGYFKHERRAARSSRIWVSPAGARALPPRLIHLHIGIVARTAELTLLEALPNRLVARSLRHFARREILAHPFFKGVHDLKVRDAPCDSERGRAVLRRAGRHACDS